MASKQTTHMPDVDGEELRRRYARERDKRNPASAGQRSIVLPDVGNEYQDPYASPASPRSPRTMETSVVVIGGGIGGILTAARLIEARIADVLIVERGADFGGTWYWNRYPGIQLRDEVCC